VDKLFAKVIQQKENEEQRKTRKVSRIDKYIDESEKKKFADEEKSDEDEKEK
jgi:hypothetical protein